MLAGTILCSLVFAPLAPTSQTQPKSFSTLWLQKLAYLACNLLTLGLGLYKCRALGLLPTGTGDWLAFETRGHVRWSCNSPCLAIHPRIATDQNNFTFDTAAGTLFLAPPYVFRVLELMPFTDPSRTVQRTATAQTSSHPACSLVMRQGLHCDEALPTKNVRSRRPSLHADSSHRHRTNKPSKCPISPVNHRRTLHCLRRAYKGVLLV